MSDHLPQVNFSDGEGLDEVDLNRAQTILDAKIYERGMRVGGLANVHGMGHVSGRGADMTQAGARVGDVMTDADAIYIPDPLAFFYDQFDISGGGDLRIVYGPQTILQSPNGSTPGTPPDGWITSFPRQLLAYTLDNDELDLGPIARPTTDPRIDAIGIRLGHSQGNNIARDFEDASTRALSTLAQDKDEQRAFEVELVQGAEAASPVAPAQTAGFGKFIEILRETGETVLDPDNVSLHAFPARLRVETVYGNEMSIGTGWVAGGAGLLNSAIEKAAGTVATAAAMSREMHEGCRLVGIGIATNQMAADVDIEISRYNISGVGAGTLTLIQDIGVASPIATSNGGYHFIGLPEFNDPIWGNGNSYGPLFSSLAVNPAESLAHSKLIVNFTSGVAWTIGDQILFVQFYYLE